MLKNILIFIIAIFLYYNCVSQIKYGVKTGLGISNVLRIEKSFVISDYEYFTPLLSYKLGVFLTIPISKKISASTEIQFTNNRNTQHLGNLSPAKSSYYHLNIPVYLNLRIKHTFTLNIGMVNAFLLGSNYFKKITNFYNYGITTGIDYTVNNKMSLSLNLYNDIKPFAQMSNLPELIIDKKHDTLYFLYALMLGISYVIN